jgi:hypothetical protein
VQQRKPRSGFKRPIEASLARLKENCRSLHGTPGQVGFARLKIGIKGRAVQERAATLGLRDWDGRTADPSASLGMTNRRGLLEGEGGC